MRKSFALILCCLSMAAAAQGQDQPAPSAPGRDAVKPVNRMQPSMRCGTPQAKRLKECLSPQAQAGQH